MFAGTPEAALPALDALLASPRHTVAAVLTRPDAPAGRGRRCRPSPVRVRAEQAGLPVLTPASLRDPQALDALAAVAPECCPVVAYGRLVPPEALERPRFGWVNLHFSLLPAWRGAAPVQHALLAGDDVTGATTFRLDAGLDTGPVFGTVTEPVLPRDTTGELLERLARSGARLLVATLDGIEDGTLAAVPQPAEGVSHAPRLSAEDLRLDWGAPAVRVDRVARAAWPAPGAWTTLRGTRVRLAPVLPDPAGAPQARPGEIVVGERGRVWAGTATAAVLLDRVQPAGRALMAAADWVRGLRLEPGEAFE